MMAVALGCLAFGASAQLKQEWGDFKLWIDPGHSGHENTGMYNYTEAQKVLRVGLATRDFLYRYTTADENTIHMTRDDDQDNVSLDERSDMANAWGADFFYSIHSDAGSGQNTTVFLFGGWKLNGEYIEKTPNGGKRYGDILCPNLTGVMYNTGTRGNYYDRVYYNGDVDTHENQYPYLSVNRRTNMASLLSEGGFHTHPVQQALNINEDYKHLEAFGTFRSIMEYLGLERPDQVMLAGVVTNSENGQGIDGVTVTVDGKTYVTDTYESTFHQYVRNANIVHNGFFLFEDLVPGQQYEITYSCPGFTSATQTVTMKTDPQGLSGDNVTWGNIQLTNEAPATITGNSIANPDAVNTRYDMVLTFSRNMNRASVEDAFSINNGGQVTLSWDNDYTLRVNLSQLAEDMFYTITIRGDVAKNSQTNQFLDGDGDGVEGGDYVFDLITIPADVEAPYITSTTPEENTLERFTQRPVIRIEYNEELAWNEDEAADAIVVEDKDGNKYEGRLTHEVVRDASVLHYYFNEDLPRDMCFKVTVKGGFSDLAGNIGQGKVFKFLSEYRSLKDEISLIGEFDQSEWYTPGGSGSSKGFTTMEEQTMERDVNRVHRADIPSSYHVHYVWDPETSEPWWGLRLYCRTTDATYITAASKYKDAVIQAYAYGDGGNHYAGHDVRHRNDEGSVKAHIVDLMHRGWQNVTWDLNHEASNFVLSGTDSIVAGPWRYDAFWIWRGRLEDFADDDPDDPRAAWEGDMWFDDLKYCHYNNEEQTASLDDITLEDPVIVPASITLNVSDGFELTEGDTYQLSATVLPEGADQAVTWTSSDELVATVDENGLVTALSREQIAGLMKRAADTGTATTVITATSVANPNVSASVILTVNFLNVGVAEITAKAVSNVKYVNAKGQTSDKPFDGVNVMVVTYTDGSVKTIKTTK